MKTTKTTKTTKQQILEALDAIQVWFARKPYGWRETATPGQLRQWDDRVREEEALLQRLEIVRG